ncbi:MAG TPA: prephenate dehydrogenase [Candidatus Acidoferrales bacterium]|jgi:prephenate dehydrogenase
MTENSAAAFHRVAILGTGLIGGSFALALRRHLPEARIVGFDREEVLAEAFARNVIHESCADLATAVRGADLVYIALPISTTIELLPEIAKHAEPSALVTDAGSTKRAICRAAAQHFHSGAIFLGGHPMAGKETEGIAAADEKLFQNAKYALIEENSETKNNPRVAAFVSLLEKMGAQPMWLDADTHDWAVAIISHLPQMAAIALAEVISAESDGEQTGLPTSLAGSGVRDALRLAGSPYSMWRDIAFTNSDNLGRALDRLAQAVEQLRTHLTSRDLENSFAEANRLHKSLVS